MLKKGQYRHYKGNLYEVLEIARHSETEELHVVYRQLYDTYDVWIRPLSMFTESVCINGKNIQRFTYQPTAN